MFFSRLRYVVCERSVGISSQDNSAFTYKTKSLLVTDEQRKVAGNVKRLTSSRSALTIFKTYMRVVDGKTRIPYTRHSKPISGHTKCDPSDQSCCVQAYERRKVYYHFCYHLIKFSHLHQHPPVPNSGQQGGRESVVLR